MIVLGRVLYTAACILMLVVMCNAPATVEYIRSTSCSYDQFYQISNLSCVDCAVNQVKSNNGWACLFCSNGYDAATGSCFPCSSGQKYEDTVSASVEIRSCVRCPSGTTPDVTTPNVTGFNCVTQPVNGASEATNLCELDDSIIACQHLLNLCVLENYDRSSDACANSINLAVNRPYTVPVIYYPELGADERLQDTSIGTTYVTSDSADGSTVLQLMAALYSYDGSFISLHSITNEIILCKDQLSRQQSAFKVGVTYHIECNVAIGNLQYSTEDPVFFDLYLLDESSNTAILHPVPILIENYVNQQGEQVNRGNNEGGWQLVKRFFLYENVSSDSGRLKIATRMQLIVELNSDGKIYQPYLKINYEIVDDSADVSFDVLYLQDQQSFDLGMGITTAILSVLVFVYIGFLVNGYMRRSGAFFCEPKTMIYLIVQLFYHLATAMFAVLVFGCSYWLLFFKIQSTLIITLLTEDQETVFEVLLGLSFSFQVLYVVWLLWFQSQVDIFLLDWERPRAANQTGGGENVVAMAPVSIWRTYFIANEWNEIQSLRKINPVLLLFIVTLILEVLGFGNLATRDPRIEFFPTEEDYIAEHSQIIRFSLTALSFLVTAVLMRAYMVWIYERFIEHKTQQFVDLCSVSNVSLLILSHMKFGHYIHGRSPHGQADTNMKEMCRNLKNEAEGLCSGRGLLAESDEQLFSVALTAKFKEEYNRILAPINAQMHANTDDTNIDTVTDIISRAEGNTARGVRGQRSSQQSGGISDASVKAYKDMNTFLASFIDHSLAGLDWVVKDKLLLEMILGVELYDPVDRCLFYTDKGSSAFTSVIFYGNEWSLLLFDILVFAIVDLIAQNYVLAAIITYIIGWALRNARDYFGKSNLGRKTLIDNRFLI